ncbi:MAG TPA: sensor histidine kinase [Terracidiphilus sp.]|nr:sensor histidine kinase [Terracidiphilus sp.]
MKDVMEQMTSVAGQTDQGGRMDAVMESLMGESGSADGLAEVAHDARNMVAALSLYCDLLEVPGVLTRPFASYGSELRLVTAASRRLVERLTVLHTQPARKKAGGDCENRPWSTSNPVIGGLPGATGEDSTPALPIANLAEEVLANRNLLAALAGPFTAVTVEADGGARPVRMTGEDLTRVMVNLVKNAAEAMPGGGRIRIVLSERPARAGYPVRLVIAVQDDGPGIPANLLERIFERGYTTRAPKTAFQDHRPAPHRGLGLAISRSLVEAAGGHLVAVKCGTQGARLEIELPVHGPGVPYETRGIAGFVVS